MSKTHTYTYAEALNAVVRRPVDPEIEKRVRLERSANEFARYLARSKDLLSDYELDLVLHAAREGYLAGHARAMAEKAS
jgi:hypothetical protein